MIARGTRFTMVVVGQNTLIDAFDNFWGEDLASRVATALNTSGGGAGVVIEELDGNSIVTLGGLLGNTVGYQATVQARTTIDFARIEDAASWITSAFASAAQHMPSSVTIPLVGGTPTGAPVPAVPRTVAGELSAAIEAIATAVKTAAQGSNVLVWAIVAGSVVVVYYLVTQPDKAARTIRAIR